jgi:aldehyde:ferredoxin oxidoreductase
LVRFACITNDLSHFAGRTGLGAVMGSKKLRAIAVHGTQPLPVADPQALKALSGEMVAASQEVIDGFRAEGTAGTVSFLNAVGGLPTRNFQLGHLENAEAISGGTMAETILVRADTCSACAVGCKRVVQVDEPYAVDPRYGGPEYETIAALGSNNGISDLVAVAKGNELCAAYGLDTISAGAVIAFVNECFEQGLLTAQDTDGLQLDFGKPEAMLSLLQAIIERRGIGNLLAEGIARAAEKLGPGAQAYALHVKGQEFPMHMPRLKPGMGLGYALSPTGAEHETNMHDTDFSEEGSPYLAGLRELGTFDPLPEADLSPGKVRMAVYQTTWMRFMDCAALCHFVPWSHLQVASLVRATTGWDSSVWELMKAGERAFALARAFNAREGFSVEDDRLPDRCFQPIPSGPLEGVAIDRGAFAAALRTYYRMAGLDEATGAPTAEKLAELDVAWAGDELARRGVYGA